MKFNYVSILAILLVSMILSSGCTSQESSKVETPAKKSIPETATEISEPETPQQTITVIPLGKQAPTTSAETIDLNFTRSMIKHNIVPSCSDLIGRESKNNESVSYVKPACYPSYFYKYEGLFLGSTNQPLPQMGRGCGKFHILVVFFDSEQNEGLLQNSSVPQSVKDKFKTNKKQALEDLFNGYTPERVFASIETETPPVEFNYAIRIVPYNTSSLLKAWDGNLKTFYFVDEAKDFVNYDVVLFLEDIRPYSGLGVRRWQPSATVPVFNNNFPFIFQLNPKTITPGLFYNELFRRNVPTSLAEYTLGQESIVTRGSTKYDVTPIYNPRTSENLNPPSNGERPTDGTKLRLLSNILNGWYDIDFDGIQDCNDDSIRATANNVDADLIPDDLDPDLTKDNSPYFWQSG